jgi:hypothetical protein
MGAKPKARSPKKQAKKTKEKPQRERFIEAARKIGVDESGAEFEGLFRRVAPPRGPKIRKISKIVN